MTAIHRSAIVPYRAAQMFNLVADIPSYPLFLPWCGGARVVSSQGNEVIAIIDIAYGGIHKSFSTRNLSDSEQSIDIRLLEGPFSDLRGFWQFKPLDEQASKISLDLEFEVANIMVSMVLTPVFTSIANQFVDRFHRRAVQLYGKPA